MYSNTIGDCVRTLKKGLSSVGSYRVIVYVLAVLFWGFTTWHMLNWEISQALFGVVVLGSAVSVYCVENMETAVENDQRFRLIGLGLSLVTGILVTAYVVVNFTALQNVRIGYGTTLDYVAAASFIAVVLYLTYDAYGIAFAGMVGGVLVYSQFGYLFPGIFNHGGLTFHQGLRIGMIGIQGVYGSLTQVMGTMVAPFLLFAGLVRTFGGFGLIIRFSLWIANYFRSGIHQMAVVSSMFIGSINGSALANTSITGSFTIPVLRSTGLERKQAAAIEAVSSTGGQIMPPIMGISAFLMADILTRPLIDIFVAAVVPAFVFYLSISIAVFQLSNDLDDTKSLDRSDVVDRVPEMEQWLDSTTTERTNLLRLFEGLQFVVPICVLFYFLAYVQVSVMRSGMYAVGALVVARTVFVALDAFTTTSERLSSSGLRLTRQSLDGLYDGLSSLAPLTIVVAAIGLLVDTLFTTGLPAKISFALIDLSGGVLAILLLLTMVLCIVLGMGLPTSASYLVVALLVAPNLIEFGIPELPAHFFVLYFAILAAITPPIAPGVVISSGISDSGFWETSVEALKIALPVFVLPFAFVYNPQLVSPEISPAMIWSAAVVILGVVILSYGLNSRRPIPIDLVSDHRILRLGSKASLVLVGIAVMIVP